MNRRQFLISAAAMASVPVCPTLAEKAEGSNGAIASPGGLGENLGSKGRVFFVATTGSDNAPGSRSQPFKTIQKAAEVMQPGDSCRVRSGTYREWITPPRGGESEKRRIVYQAEPGEDVVIKGSERITSWVKQSNGIWAVELPDHFFNSFNPYKTNLSGGWLNYGKEFHLGMVYLNERPFRERMSIEEVSSETQTYYIEDGGSTTDIYANFGNADPNAELAEINVRECIFFPSIKGLKYITVDGFSMRHAAANWVCFRAFQHAALGTYWGQNWIIENCSISDARCAGIVCGNDPSAENTGFDVESVGRHIVRNNHIFRCGEAGIHGYKGWAGSIIEYNLIEDINVWNEFGGDETGAIKLHDAVDVTIRHNVIRRVRAGEGEFAGIWIDWGAQGTRVSGNVVYDMDAWPLFLQNENGPVLVDNNIFSGTVGTSSGNSVFVHNLFSNCLWSHKLWEGAQTVFWKPHTAQLAGIAQVRFENDRYLNNIFVDRGAETIPHAPGFRIDRNVYYRGAAKSPWGDQNSIVVSGTLGSVQFKSLPDGVEVTFQSSLAPLQVKCPLITRERIGVFPLTGQGIENRDGAPVTISRDILENRRNSANPTAGPIEKLKVGDNIVRLTVGPKRTDASQLSSRFAANQTHS